MTSHKRTVCSSSHYFAFQGAWANAETTVHYHYVVFVYVFVLSLFAGVRSVGSLSKQATIWRGTKLFTLARGTTIVQSATRDSPSPALSRTTCWPTQASETTCVASAERPSHSKGHSPDTSRPTGIARGRSSVVERLPPTPMVPGSNPNQSIVLASVLMFYLCGSATSFARGVKQWCSLCKHAFKIMHIL